MQEISGRIKFKAVLICCTREGNVFKREVDLFTSFKGCAICILEILRRQNWMEIVLFTCRQIATRSLT